MNGTCYWCAKPCEEGVCPHCGVQQVVANLFQVALLLKHQGVAKFQIAKRIESMDDAEFENLRKVAARHRS